MSKKSIFKKIIKKNVALIMAVMIVYVLLSGGMLSIPVAASPSAPTSTPYISYAGQVVDSITYRGVTTNAIYKPWPVDDTDSTYNCAALVRNFYRNVYGITVSGLWNSSSVPQASSGSFSSTRSPRKGDIVRYNNETHWAIVKEVNGSTVTLIQQNAWWKSHTCAQVGVTVGASDDSVTFFTYSGYLPDKGFQYSVENVSGGAGCVNLRGWVFNENNITKPIQIHAYIDGGPGSGAAGYSIDADVSRPDVGSVYNCGEFHGFEKTLTGISAGTHVIQLFANDQYLAQSQKIGDYTVTVTSDNQKPVISDVKVTNITENGYTVTCKVTDDHKIAKVAFPTWTVNNGQDDIVWHQGTISGNTASYNVRITEHNNEKNCEYITHIYAWDTAENQTSVSTEKIFVGTISVTSVTLDKSSLTLKNGDTANLVATVSPSNATNKSVTWSSSDSSVASVSGGKVTANKAGSATITATAGGKSASCNVTVSDPAVAVKSVSLDKSAVTIQKGKSTTLTATVKPSNATNKKVTWSSSDNDVATVDSSGTVRGVKAGTATITAKAGGKSASCKVTVKNGSVSVSSVSLNRSAVTLQKGKSTTLTATVKPDNATNKTVTWKSSNTKVATVSSAGKVTAKAVGTATITATAGNKSANCKVTVRNSSSTIHGVNCPSAKYIDVNQVESNWTHLPIDYALEKGYMAGMSYDRFVPDGTVTRAQIVQILYAKEGKPGVSGKVIFRDVPLGKWYSNAIEWASANGVVSGYPEGTFKPDQAITREQMVTILRAYAGYKGKNTAATGNVNSFPDSGRISNYALQAMRWAVGNRLIGGTGKGIEPQGTATRAQIAVILKAYDQNIG